MLDIAVCDDDLYFLGQMEEVLYSMEKAYAIKFEVDVYQKGDSLVEEVKAGRYYDIICMDIRMEGMDGVEAARCIRRLDRAVQLIYVTSYDSYMKEVFEVSPCGFIAKPLNLVEFEKTFRRVLQTVMGQDTYYRFRYNKVDYKVPMHDILYFVSDLRKTNIVCKDGCYTQYKKLDDIEITLEQGKSQFLRIHKSYLVNYRHIVRLTHNEVKLSNGKDIPVSNQWKQELKQQLKKLTAVLPR